jgi:aminopeptidase N
MRQLETMIGEENLRDGLREYLKTFSFGNATWDDLINILDARTDIDLQEWSQVWVKEPQMPILSTKWEVENEKISRFAIQQERKSESSAYWQQETTVTLFYPDSMHQLDVTIEGETIVLEALQGLPAPLAVLPCSAPISYGYYKLDAQSREYLLQNSPTFEDPVLRGATSLALYEAFLNGAFAERQDYFNGLLPALDAEEEPLNRQRLLSQLSTVFWRFLPNAERQTLAPALEKLLWTKLQEASAAGAKRSYFETYRDIATTAEAIQTLKTVYEKDQDIAGLTFSESDRNDLAIALALRLPEEADQIMEQEIDATQNADRKKYLAFVKPALSPDQSVRDTFFESLKQAENREIEPYVADALQFLNHPLRGNTAIKYIRPSLELMEEIQATGDIFFPRRWVGAALGGHSSPEAAQIVRDFLAERPDYPFRLKNKILMGADLLFRAAEQQPDS